MNSNDLIFFNFKLYFTSLGSTCAGFDSSSALLIAWPLHQQSDEMEDRMGGAFIFHDLSEAVVHAETLQGWEVLN